MSVKVLIIGVGLIGGSLGMALKDSARVDKVLGVDDDSEALSKALEMGAIDAVRSLSQGAGEADVIFICTPLSCYPEIIQEIGPYLKAGCIVSDVGSTKQEVMCLLQDLPPDIWKIGGHPMAGAETRGINGADRYLFENAAYILTPAYGTPPEALNLLVDLLIITGARIKTLTATRHDELVAAISHVPHLVAAALVNLTGGEEEHLMMAAGGFRDTTRIASSNPELWEDIIFSNQEIIVNKLDELIDDLNQLKMAISGGDKAKINRKLCWAKETRDRIPRVHRGIMPGFSDIVCIVPDRPGIIGQLGSILNERDINIVDIEILRVREGDGGTIRLGVPSAEDACQAVVALQAYQIKAWAR